MTEAFQWSLRTGYSRREAGGWVGLLWLTVSERVLITVSWKVQLQFTFFWWNETAQATGILDASTHRCRFVGLSNFNMGWGVNTSEGSVSTDVSMTSRMNSCIHLTRGAVGTHGPEMKRQMWALRVSQRFHTGRACRGPSCTHACMPALQGYLLWCWQLLEAQGHVTRERNQHLLTTKHAGRVSSFVPQRSGQTETLPQDEITQLVTTGNNFISTLWSSLCNSS